MLLLTHPFRLGLERLVGAHLHRPWKIQRLTDLKDYASHPAALLSDGTYTIFAKVSDAPDGRAQMEAEVAGLRLLNERAGVPVPTVLGVLDTEAGTVLVMEAVTAVERGPAQWRDIGRTLARLHEVASPYCGLETDGYFGPLPQANTPTPDWPTFYAEHRLRPNLKLAVEAGHLPPALARAVDRLIERVPALGGPAITPALLHGDAQQHNFISTAAGTVVIDPAVHYGHPEYDLALLDYFHPVPADVFAGYRELRPIDPGFVERRDLWRLSAWLAVVSVAGADYLPQLEAALRHYQ